MPIGAPHHRLDETPSTNDAARDLVRGGAEHGTTVSTGRQTAGKGRQGRSWEAPAGAIAVSVVVHEPVDRLLPLRAGLAVARLAGPAARVKWPNDVLVDGRKVAGVLVELEGEVAVVGIGVNAAVDVDALPGDVAMRAGSLGLAESDLDDALAGLLEHLGATLELSAAEVVAALAARDALVGQAVHWNGGEGTATGIAEDGSLRVQTADGETLLNGGEVHLL